MAAIFGSIDTLDACQACGVAPFAVDESGFFEDVGAFGQTVEEVVGVGIAHSTVVAEAALPAVAGELLGRLCASGTVSTQTVFDDYQSMHVNAYLLENGGTVADTREKAARTLMKSCEADMSDTVEPGWKENTLNELLAMARGEGRSKGMSR